MTYTLFARHKKLSAGSAAQIRAALADATNQGLSHLLAFDDETGRQIDFDPSSVSEQESAPDQPPTPRKPGRPSLGVVAREVTLLPQHWEWLATQPGGASVTLRKLVTQAKKSSAGMDERRRASEAVYQFLRSIAGDLPNYEEVTRALFAGDFNRMLALMADWPADIRDYAQALIGPASSSL